MVNTNTILKELKANPKLPEILEGLNDYLENEKNNRIAFYEWLTDDIKAEFIEGEVIIDSPVVKKHNLVTLNLALLLQTCVEKYKLGYVGIEKILIKLSRNDYEPDICFFNKKVAKQFNDETMFFPAPDFVVEVVSKSTEKKDRGIKFTDYALHGIKEYWIIDSTKETVEQYINSNSSFEILKIYKSNIIKSFVIPQFEIQVAAIFNEKIKREALKLFL